MCQLLVTCTLNCPSIRSMLLRCYIADLTAPTTSVTNRVFRPCETIERVQNIERCPSCLTLYSSPAVKTALKKKAEYEILFTKGRNGRWMRWTGRSRELYEEERRQDKQDGRVGWRRGSACVSKAGGSFRDERGSSIMKHERRSSLVEHERRVVKNERRSSTAKQESQPSSVQYGRRSDISKQERQSSVVKQEKKPVYVRRSSIVKEPWSPSYMRRGSYTDRWDTEKVFNREMKRDAQMAMRDERPRKKSEYVAIPERKNGYKEDKMRRNSAAKMVRFSNHVEVATY